MAEVVAEADRLGEVLVEAQRPCHRARDPGRLEGVCEPRPVVIAAWVDELLRLVLEASERLRVDDAVAVTLEGGPEPALVVLMKPSARLVAAHRKRREPGFFLVSNPPREGVRNSPGELGHVSDSSRWLGRAGTAFRADFAHPNGGRKRAPEVTLSRKSCRVRRALAPKVDFFAGRSRRVSDDDRHRAAVG